MSKKRNIILLLAQLREYMRSQEGEACLILQNDPHLSEFVSDYYKIREFFSGFDGSAGVLLVGLDFAILWTDGRYFIQAKEQLSGTGIELYKQGVEGVPSLQEYLFGRFNSNDVIIANANCVSANLWNLLSEKICLKDDCGWEKIWKDRPQIKKSNIWRLDWAEKDVSSNEKIGRLRSIMLEEGVDWCLISALDEFSWLFNLRASDIEYTPVARGYAIVGLNVTYVFLDSETPIDINAKIYNYEEIDSVLSDLKGKVWVDASKINAHLYNICKSNLYVKESPIVALKAVKSHAEIEGFRLANIYDGVVWVRMRMFLEEVFSEGLALTELDVNEKIRELKMQNDCFVSESFESIVAYGANAAIVHYSATKESNSRIFGRGFLLIDSGTHYNVGTTDITRTIVCGELSSIQKKRYTQVLKGMIAIAVAEFSEGTTGADIDALARQFLKEDDVDFMHGTGHGIGSVLCVHEDGMGISPRYIKPILVGMVSSDEPGYYKQGEYGIRIENMLLSQRVSEEKIGFETLTMVPIDLEAIMVELLTEKEKKWINNYHKNIKVKLREYLSDTEFLWLENKYYEI